MKLRFGIDTAALDVIRARLEATCEKPPVGRRLSDVYLDTPDDALAAYGVALRYRLRAALGVASAGRPWRRQEIWARDVEPRSLKKLGVKRLRQRLDATFSVRVERWTWQLDGGWASVSLDQGELSTGRATEAFTAMRIVCRRKHADAAMRFAVGLGATRLTSMEVRERGRALLRVAASPG